MGLIGFLIVGLIAGFVARAVVPGRDPMGLLGTLLLGIVGSFVGGLIFSLLGPGPMQITATGLLGSILGAIVALLIYRKVAA